MGKIIPLLLALIFSISSQCFACCIRINDTKILFSTYVIRFGLYFLLLSLPLYIRSLRRIHRIPDNMLEFVLGLFVIESTLVYIWFPLENAVFCLIPLMSRALMPYFRNYPCVEAILWNNVNAGRASCFYSVTSYILSLFIFVCILHGTRTVDFRIIKYFGFPEFFEDTMCRLTDGFKSIIRKKKYNSATRRPGKRKKTLK